MKRALHIAIDRAEKAEAEVARLREALAVAANNFGAYFTTWSSEHEDDSCPQDDTCECESTQSVDRAFDALRAALAAPETAGKDVISRADLDRVISQADKYVDSLPEHMKSADVAEVLANAKARKDGGA